MHAFGMSRFLFWFVILFLVALSLRPWVERTMIQRQADSRAITPRGELAADEMTAVSIFESTNNSVVDITTTKQFFDLQTHDLRQNRQVGSGVVWDAYGHVVTNYHVIKGVHAAYVRLADRRTYDAVVVGISRDYDIAVLRISVGSAPPVPVAIGTSSDLKVGQRAYVIGNPFGLERTLSVGVISALERRIEMVPGHVYEHLIQTDAAINPGNSGGPLLDSAGRLVGIISAILSSSGSSSGIGFAVPVDIVSRIVPDLVL